MFIYNGLTSIIKFYTFDENNQYLYNICKFKVHLLNLNCFSDNLPYNYFALTSKRSECKN